MANESHYTNLVEESKLVHCCTRSLRDGLWSGLLGTLQKYGYTELNRASIVAAFRDACHILIQLQGSGENYPSIKGKDIGVMVLLGLNHMITTFGVQPTNRTCCEPVIQEVRCDGIGDCRRDTRSSQS